MFIWTETDARGQTVSQIVAKNSFEFLASYNGQGAHVREEFIHGAYNACSSLASQVGWGRDVARWCHCRTKAPAPDVVCNRLRLTAWLQQNAQQRCNCAAHPTTLWSLGYDGNSLCLWSGWAWRANLKLLPTAIWGVSGSLLFPHLSSTMK